jgi:23S rRNA-/tRNA-specific pseudouridylate synthase
VSDEHFWNSLPLGSDVSLLSRDPNGIAAFAKPEGVLSHPNSTRDEGRSLLRCAYDLDKECYHWNGGASKLWLLNRLDSATSGLMLACSDEKLALHIRDQFKKKQVKKVYVALVFGAPRERKQLWKDTLQVVKKGGQVRAGKGGNIPSESTAILLQTSQGYPKVSLIRLEPKTGRSHQLRVQCAKRSVPIVGDQTYGDFRANREFAKKTRMKRLFLHSLQTSFSYESHGRSFEFKHEAPLPEEFFAAVSS